MTSVKRIATLLLLSVVGCSQTAMDGGRAEEGSEQAAREFFTAEFEKWMAGADNEVDTMAFRIGNLQPPVGYDFRSVVPDKPDPMASESAEGLTDDWRSWPAYRLNVFIDWKSQADTPLEKVTTYRLTWNPNEKKWYVEERSI